MKVIHVARKPLVGTVAKTALKHGTGGLNIDRSRLGTKESLDGGAYAQTATPRPNPEEWRFKRGGARSKLPGDDREGAAAGMYQPGNTATALVALAATGGIPVKTSAGKVRKVPPPAMVFNTPAPKAAISKIAISLNVVIVPPHAMRRLEPC